MKLSRDQKEWQMICTDVISGKTIDGIKELDIEGWVELHESNQILSNGLFAHISERDGYQHIYLERPNGRFTVPVTSGQWEVKEIIHIDESRGYIFTANKNSVLNNQLYSVRFDGTKLNYYSRIRYHSISMSGNGKYFIDSFSSIDQPPKINFRNNDGSLIRTIAETDMSSFNIQDISKPKVVRFLADDKNTVLNGLVTLPQDYKEGKTYPFNCLWVWYAWYSNCLE